MVRGRKYLSPCGCSGLAGRVDMRRGCRALLVGPLVALLTLAVGCRLFEEQQPVPGELLTCRQLTQRATSAMERGDFARAETMLAQAVASCETDAAARRHYAEALWQRGAADQAIAQMMESVRLAPEDAALRDRLAEMHMHYGHFEEAMAQSASAIDLDPTSARGWAVRGAVKRQTGDLRGALADYQRALHLDGENREYLFATAELYRQLDDPRRALVNLLQLLDSYAEGEEPGEALYLAGLAYAAMGRVDDALGQYELARQRGPITPELLDALSAAYLQSGNPAQAELAARDALALEPGRLTSQELLYQSRATSQALARPVRR